MIALLSRGKRIFHIANKTPIPLPLPSFNSNVPIYRHCTMFLFAHQRSEMAPTAQLLRSAEALTMPGVQVIILNANMCCLDCRDKVSTVLSKMDNLLDYVVDVTQKKVIVRGRVDPKKRRHRIRLMANDKKRKSIEFQRLGGEGYSSDVQQQYCSGRPKKSTDNLLHQACCFHCASS